MRNVHAGRVVRLIFFLAVVAFFNITGADAQSPATIRGSVFTAAGEPIPDTTVTLLELRRAVRTGADGSYVFENVPAGHYHVQAESPRFGSALGEAQVNAGATRTVEIVLDPAVHAEQIVVSASADTRRESEVYQPIAVMDNEEIAARLEGTLGETLNEQPGVNSTFFGAGASRPIIRGLGSDRIRVLEEGVGTGDASNISPDHAVSVDPGTAERIEILRGPATLLYGSNAVGGVVNIIDARVPNTIPAKSLTGHVDLRLGSVASERAGSVNLTGGHGQFAWRASFLGRETDDYEIPGPADEHDDEPEELTGVLENSAVSSKSATLGGSWIGSRGYVGLAVSGFDTDYGVPGHHHHDEEMVRRTLQEEEEVPVTIDMEQRRFDVKGELNNLGFLRNIRLRVGRNEYEHVELEGEEIGTRFNNEGVEARLEASHQPVGVFRGSMGVQYTNNDFAARGEEAFIPPNKTDSAAVFAFEEFTVGKWDLQFGARYESQDNEVDPESGLPSRSFNGLSGSAGAIFRFVEGMGMAISLSRAVRLPTATELFANGPHAATRQFEIGDIDLDEETSLGIDVSLRKTTGRVRAELNLFQNYFEGYIFEAATGDVQDEFPVFQFIQSDARFRGFEIDTHTEVWHGQTGHLELEAGTDFVRATLDDGGNLPRIPPFRLSLGLRYEGGPWSAMAEARRYAEQDEVADLEEPTGGYTLVNAMIGYRFFVSNTIHELMLRASNLTDELARVHTSPLKEIAPLPGRDFNLSYRLTF